MTYPALKATDPSMAGQESIWQAETRAGWPSDAQQVGEFLLSGPAANRIGCFQLQIAVIAETLAIPAERIDEILALLEYDGLVRYDRAHGWIWVLDVLRRRPFIDSDEVRRALPELAAVPRDACFRDELVKSFRVSADRPAGPVKPQPAPQGTNIILDYLKRCRAFLLELVNTRPLRMLGILFIVLAILFVIFPGIDLGVARWFFVPPRHFVLGETWIGRFFDSDVHFGMEWFLGLLVGVFLYSLYRRRVFWNLTPRNFLFVALTIALGAGLVTNVVFKDSWGRARPSQILEFGGPKQFSPPFMRSTQCDKNCSFVSGDASLAASFLAFAVIAQRNRRRWWIGLGTFTAIVGFMRMGRGSHFLSDVVFAVLFTVMIMLVLARVILEDRWRDWPRWRQAGRIPEVGASRHRLW
jgi:lipid A 4'-phosphatase